MVYFRVPFLSSEHFWSMDQSYTLAIVSSSISLFSTLVMILLYMSFSKLRESSRGYLLMINICDFCCSLCFLLSAIETSLIREDIERMIEVIFGWSTHFQGFLIQFFYLASFCWTACYSIYLCAIDDEIIVQIGIGSVP